MSIEPFDIETALKLGQFALDAYGIWKSSDPANFQPVTPGYDIIETIYANDLFDDVPDYVIYGFIAQSVGEPFDVIVAIRGTEGVFEWMRDADFFQVQCPFLTTRCQTEQGFTGLYESLGVAPHNGGDTVKTALQKLIEDGQITTLTITGHSLGGALSTLLAADLAGNKVFTPTVYTFASPAVGDKSFAGLYDDIVPGTRRIANASDIVPHLPPAFIGYVHVDTLFPINSGASTKNTLLCHHSMATYLHTLNADVPIDPDCRP